MPEQEKNMTRGGSIGIIYYFCGYGKCQGAGRTAAARAVGTQPPLLCG